MAINNSESNFDENMQKVMIPFMGVCCVIVGVFYSIAIWGITH